MEVCFCVDGVFCFDILNVLFFDCNDVVIFDYVIDEVGYMGFELLFVEDFVDCCECGGIRFFGEGIGGDCG